MAGSSKSTIVDWNDSPKTPYDHGFVDKIKDSTTTQKEITSIPSPFARVELVKEAFGKIVPESIAKYNSTQVENLLHGNSIYHKMVSDSLDVAQIFFCYPSMEDKVEIKVWNKDECLKQLESSNEKAHKNLGSTLRMFFEQDSKGEDPYNFGKMQNIYILRYIGPGQRPMHIIGATSPATLFFSTANDESALSKNLCFGQDYAFDSEYASLDQRDPEFIKYLFTFKYSDSSFSTNYPEVDKYLEAVFSVLPDQMKNELNSIQNECLDTENGKYIDKHYERLTIKVSSKSEIQVEVNGNFIHYKSINPKGNSDFEIKPSKDVDIKPLVLPVNNSNVYKNLEYYGSLFGQSFSVPFVDKNSFETRRLPGINIQFPYLTISDFLYDKIIMLPAEVEKEYFFDGNFFSNSGYKQGFLLPVKPLFYDFFTSENLMGKSPSGKNTIDIRTVASGVEVTLRVPIRAGEVEYKRIYTLDVKADEENNRGAIVIAPEDFTVGIFPPIKFRATSDAHYRIALLSDFTLNKESSCVCHNSEDGFFTPDYVVRNVDIDGDIRSKVYFLNGQDFDCANISILTDQGEKEKRATGLMIPKFKQRTGSSSFKFAIDLGTSNTHIEYTTGDDQMPQPFAFNEESPQFSMLCKPSDVIRNHIRGEFIPEKIGENAQCHFPMRTVLCIDRNNAGINEKGIGAYVPFGNASPAFMYNHIEVGTKYNDFVPNLKWSKLDSVNEERIRCYIESLFLIIRNKVIQEGGSLTQTQIKWFYPISMSNNKRGLFERVWEAAYKKYFNPSGKPVAITESVAPYSFFQKTMASVTKIVTIDIGGGTTDIVVADTNDVKLVTSMRFAADAIFGSSLISVQNGTLNGIIKQFKDKFINALNGLDDLQKMLREKTAKDFGNSSEVASFLFSLSENEQVRQQGLETQLNFNEALMRDGSQKIVFYVFFTAIMYHLANLMKNKGLDVPTNIAFSGNGSKVVSVLSPAKESLELLTTKIFDIIYGTDVKNINLIINSTNPKEATCKGGLFLDSQPISVSSAKSVLLGIDPNTMVSDQKYADVPNLYDNVVSEVKKFMDFITLRLPKVISLSNEFGIDKKSVDLAVECFNKDLKTYIEKGVNLKLDSNDVSGEDIIEEPLFFYPIIGVINDLSEQIYNQVKGSTSIA
jgi:hypothetical protein